MALGEAEAVVGWEDGGTEWRVPLDAGTPARLGEAAEGGSRALLDATCPGLSAEVDAWAGGEADSAALDAAAAAVASAVLERWAEEREARAERYARRGHGHLV